MILSAKPSSTALFAFIHVSLSMRCDSLARDRAVLIGRGVPVSVLTEGGVYQRSLALEQSGEVLFRQRQVAAGSEWYFDCNAVGYVTRLHSVLTNKVAAGAPKPQLVIREALGKVFESVMGEMQMEYTLLREE